MAPGVSQSICCQGKTPPTRPLAHEHGLGALGPWGWNSHSVSWTIVTSPLPLATAPPKGTSLKVLRHTSTLQTPNGCPQKACCVSAAKIQRGNTSDRLTTCSVARPTGSCFEVCEGFVS